MCCVKRVSDPRFSVRKTTGLSLPPALGEKKAMLLWPGTPPDQIAQEACKRWHVGDATARAPAIAIAGALAVASPTCQRLHASWAIWSGGVPGHSSIAFFSPRAGGRERPVVLRTEKRGSETRFTQHTAPRAPSDEGNG